MEASTHRQAIVDGAGDLTRALRGLDPAPLRAAVLKGIQGMPKLFSALVGAEMVAAHAGQGVTDAEDAIAAAADRILDALDCTGAPLPVNVQALAVGLRAKLQEAGFTGCVPA